MSTDDKEQRIIQSRMRLRERFLNKAEQTPSVADPSPQGTGDSNRHGMPKLPVGQHETKKWPVLDLGIHPTISKDEWQLTLSGLCDPTTLSWDDFQSLDIVTDVSDFHCVTAWSRFDIAWRGVRFSELCAVANVSENANYVMCHAYDDYTTNLSMVEATKDDVLLVFEADGEPLPKEHGGPVRMITPQLYAWKGAKWIREIHFMAEDSPGFWEQRGYSMTAYPWRNDRYS